MEKRELDICVISDLHLGTFGCHAKELNDYLKSISPKRLVLNGDEIDIWNFRKRYFPKSHMGVIKQIFSLLSSGTEVYYITGNHDEMLRKFKGFRLGEFRIENKLILTLNHKRVWVFHGDVFDVTMKHSKWLAKLGGLGYDLLIVINTVMNWISERMGYGRISLSKKIKNSVKGAIKFINDFEKTATDIAIENQFDYVVCGHIHQPQIKEIRNQKGKTIYLNSGDWIENLTALEYYKNEWTLYEYNHDRLVLDIENKSEEKTPKDKKKENEKIFDELLKEFQLKHM